jgi:hypothetical protein
MASNPRLVEELQGLAVVRDLVASLSRPAARADLAESVITTLERRRTLFRLVPRSRLATVRLAGFTSAAAAVLLLATLVSSRWSGARKDVGPEAPPPAHAVAPVAESTIERPDPALAVRQPAEVTETVAVAATTPRDENGKDSLRPDADDRRREADAEQFRAWLDSPNLRKIFLVTDTVGGEALRQVGDLVESTPRKNATFGRITVTQGIVFDPDHPGEAIVYAVVMDDQELNRFQADLAKTFRTSLREVEPPPQLVTQLADVGQIAVLPGTPVAELVPEEVSARALRSERGKPHSETTRIVAGANALDPLDLARHTEEADRLPGSARHEPVPSRSQKDSSHSPSSAQPAPKAPSVVLVWVEPMAKTPGPR